MREGVIFLADRVTTIRLRAEIADLKRQMSEAGVAVKGVGDEAEKAGQRSTAALGQLSNTAGLLGLALVAAAGVAVMAFANFDESMSAVQAATRASAEDMDLLREAALQAGADTKYSATEAAGAITALSKAGVSTADILGGGLSGALDLAASGQIDVAQAAEIAATSMNQFELKGSDASHVADLLAAAAGKAMGEVTDMAGALKFVGPVAHDMGISIEETAGTIAYLAQQGILGEMAGTSLRGMLTSLTSPSSIARQNMDELGISVYDAGGQFVGFNGIAEQLQTSMADLTASERDEAFGRIFGNEQITTARLLYKGGAEAIDGWTEKVNDSGFAAEDAGIKMNNLKGDWEQLTGSIETSLINLGESADAPLRGLVQGATAVVNKLGEMPAAAQGVTLALLGGGGLILLGVAGIGKLTIAVSEAITSFKALSTTAKVSGGIAAGVFAIGTLALMAWASQAAEAAARTEELQGTLDDLGNTTNETLSTINANLSKNRDGWLEGIFGADPESLIDKAEKFGLTVEDLQGAIFGEADAMDRVNAATSEYAGNNNLRTTEANKFSSALQGEKDALTEAERAQGQKILADETAGVAQGEVADAYDVTTDSIGAQVPALEDLIALQQEAAGVVLSERDAQRAFQSAILDATAALEENGQTLDITTEAGIANQAALDDIAKSGWDVIASMQANGATQAELQAAMQVSRDAFVAMAVAEGVGADEANRLADEMGLIPAKVSPVVTVDTAGAERDVERLKAILRSIPGVVITPEMRAGTTYYTNRAGGGQVFGPGTTTSDSIPALLSNREYVVKADAVDHYGPAFFDQLNAMRFASGGYVGGGSSSAPAPATPALTFDYRRLAREIAKVQITLDGRALNQSVDERLGGMIR